MQLGDGSSFSLAVPLHVFTCSTCGQLMALSGHRAPSSPCPVSVPLQTYHQLNPSRAIAEPMLPLVVQISRQ
jgi:hypothetical protein